MKRPAAPYVDPFEPAPEAGDDEALRLTAKTYEPCPTCHWRPDMCGCPKEAKETTP